MFFDAYKYDLQASFEKCFNVPDKKIQKSKKLLYELCFAAQGCGSTTPTWKLWSNASSFAESHSSLSVKRRLIGKNSGNLFNILSGVASEDPTDEKEERCLLLAAKREVVGDTRKESGSSCALSAGGVKPSMMDKEPVS